MGYETYFIISRVDGNEDDYNKIVEELKEESGLDLKSGDSAKWYDSHEDCLKVSKKYPGVMFQLDGDGANSDDVWATRYKGGESETVESMMPPFQKMLTAEEKEKNAKKECGILIYYVDPDTANEHDEVDFYHLDRETIDKLTDDGIGCLMSLEDFVCKFNAEEISDLGYIAKY